MKTFYTKYFPIKPYKGLALYPFVFFRSKPENVYGYEKNHQRTHLAQQKELLIIGYYILLIVFWFLYGYEMNPFEREALRNQWNYNYVDERKLFNWRVWL